MLQIKWTDAPTYPLIIEATERKIKPLCHTVRHKSTQLKFESLQKLHPSEGNFAMWKSSAQIRMNAQMIAYLFYRLNGFYMLNAGSTQYQIYWQNTIILYHQFYIYFDRTRFAYWNVVMRLKYQLELILSSSSSFFFVSRVSVISAPTMTTTHKKWIISK